MERALELDHEDWLPARGPIELTCRAELQLLIFGERRVSSWPRAGMLPRTAAGDSLAASFRFAPPLGSPFSQAIGEVAIGAARARDASFLSTHSSDPLAPLTETPRRTETAPIFSPDGSRIAFLLDTSQEGYGFSDLYTMAADGSDVQRLTHTPKRREYPRSWQALSS